MPSRLIKVVHGLLVIVLVRKDCGCFVVYVYELGRVVM